MLVHRQRARRVGYVGSFDDGLRDRVRRYALALDSACERLHETYVRGDVGGEHDRNAMTLELCAVGRRHRDGEIELGSREQRLPC